MKRTVLLVFAFLMLAAPANALEGAEHMKELRKDQRYAFCSAPPSPLQFRQREMCSIASEVSDCAALQAACAPEPMKPEEPRSDFWKALASLGRVLVWLLVVAGAAALIVPIAMAIMRARRDKKVADKTENLPNAAVAIAREAEPELDEITDAEAALREAQALAQRGDNVRALSLYLAASLAALDRRGAIRIARHRTNGEYVRSCQEDDSRLALRAIVREVDRAQFGKLAPSAEAMNVVASRAMSVVRVTATMMLLLVACGGLAGCKMPSLRSMNDPAGNELPMEILRRSGFDVAYTATSLASLPLPTEHDAGAVIVIDVDDVPLEEEAEGHLVHWVEAGGVLVLAGHPHAWPKKLKATSTTLKERHYRLLSGSGAIENAVSVSPRELTWEKANAFARIDSHMYGARKYLKNGLVLGIAGDELVTNLGVSIPANADALVALMEDALGDRFQLDTSRGAAGADGFALRQIRFARAGDGIPGPSNPFAALQAAGLGKGAWHALAAALVLFLAYGIRHARAKPQGVATRRAFREHVEATGAFYGRTKAHSHALAAYAKFAEMRLRDRVARGGDPVAFLAARAEADRETVERTWKRAMGAEPEEPRRGDELGTIAQLRALLARALER